MKVDKVNIPLPKAITITDPNELFDLHNQLGVTQSELGALNKGGKNVRNKQINYEHIGLKKTGTENTPKVPTITTKEEFNNLPSGSNFYRNGVLYTK